VGQTVLQKNLKALENLSPGLVERLDRVCINEKNIEVFAGRLGQMTGRARGPNGLWVTLHSTVDPRRESDRIIERLQPLAGGTVVLLGIGLGYPLLALINQSEAKNRPIIVVERDLFVFQRALEFFDWTPFLRGKDLHFVIGEDGDQVMKAITRIRIKKGFQKVIVIPHGPSLRIDPDFYTPLLDELRLLEASPLTAKLDYRRLGGEHLTVLVLDSSYFLIRECIKTLRSLGHRVVPVSISEGRLVETILGHVAQARPDFLLSVNHLGFDEKGKLTELLEALRLPYAVWYVDSPTFIVKNFRGNVSPYCVMFIWDRSYLESMMQFGFQKIHFLPLATDPSVFRRMRKGKIPPCFRGAVSFVGNSMVEAVEDWASRFPHDSTTEAISRLAISIQMENHQLPMEEILETITRDHGLQAEFKDPIHHLNFQAALVWKATLEYRKNLVNSLEPFDMRVYGDNGWSRILNGRVKISPPVDYYRDLPMVFNGTDVNLNATSFQMNLAVNQRVFDAAACGAVLVTDNQPDMEELFDPAREAIRYENVAQAREEVAYYLKHQQDRRRIAERARRRVLAEHTYVHRLQRMVTLIRDEFR